MIQVLFLLSNSPDTDQRACLWDQPDARDQETAGSWVDSWGADYTRAALSPSTEYIHIILHAYALTAPSHCTATRDCLRTTTNQMWQLHFRVTDGMVAP